MIKLAFLQMHIMTKQIRISNKIHKELKKEATDREMTIQEVAEERLA